MDEKIVLMGVDSSKTVFECKGVNAAGETVYKKSLTRSKLFEVAATLPKCTIATEACGGSNYLARELKKRGHDAKLISPQFVKPYVQSNKNDPADAAAIVEAASRPSMRYVPIKQEWQQDIQSLHRIRSRLSKEKTALTNEMRGLLAEYGIVIPRGDSNLIERASTLLSTEDHMLSETMRFCLQRLYTELFTKIEEIKVYENKLAEITKDNRIYKRLDAIKGIGLIGITLLIISLADPSVFKNGRHFSAWLGLVPRHSGTGGKNKIGKISKRGDKYIRSILIHGARSAVRVARQKAETGKHQLTPLERWVFELSEKKGVNKAAVALANKNARIAWAIVAHDREYDNKLASFEPNSNVA